MLIDSHVHLDTYTNAEVSEILVRAASVGVGVVISAGTTLESSRRSLELSALFPRFFCGVGIHPMDIREPIDEQMYAALRKLAVSSEKVVVVSEIGLDFMDGAPDRAIQYQAFREQIRLARELGLPIIFHSRESHDEVLRVLKEERAYEVGGVFHYFQDTEATARRAIDMGFHISLARPLLRLPHLQEAASRLPLEWLVLETDSAPQPFKPKRENWTEPRHTRDVARKLAELQGRDESEIEDATTQNVKRLLGEKWEVIRRYVCESSTKLR